MQNEIEEQMKEERKNEECRCVKDELRMRVQMMYTQNMSVISTAFAIWAIGGTVLAVMLDKGIANESLKMFIYLFFSVPAILAVPLSIKSGDNLSKVARLAAYIRVFHEMKAAISGEKEFPFYESALKASMTSQGPLKRNVRIFLLSFNCEFSMIVLISFLAVLFCFCYDVFGGNDFGKRIGSFSGIVGIITLIILVGLFILVWMNSNEKKKFFDEIKKSEDDFIAVALKFSMITEDDVKRYRELTEGSMENSNEKERRKRA